MYSNSFLYSLTTSYRASDAILPKRSLRSTVSYILRVYSPYAFALLTFYTPTSLLSPVFRLLKVIGLIINLIEHTLLRGCGSDNYIEKCQKVPPDKKQYTLTKKPTLIAPLKLNIGNNIKVTRDVNISLNLKHL